MQKLLVICAVVFGLAGVSHAGVLIEPYVGYESGTLTSKTGGDGKVTGSQYGLRLAYKLPVMFWLGVDGTMGKITVKPDNGGASVDWDRTMFSAVAGVNFPILLRGWVSYGFSNEVKTDNSKMKGNSMKVGLGYSPIPFVSLNVEYLSETFTDVETGGVTASTDSKNSGYIVSLSVPF